MILKHWKLLVVLIISIFLLYKYAPEKELDYSSKLTPIAWLDEETFLVGNRGTVFLKQIENRKLEIFSTLNEDNELGFDNFCIDDNIWTANIRKVIRSKGVRSTNLGTAYGDIYKNSKGNVVITQNGIVPLFGENISTQNAGKCWREIAEYTPGYSVDASIVDGIYKKYFYRHNLQLGSLSTDDSKAFGQNHFDKAMMFISNGKNGVIFSRDEIQYVLNLPAEGIPASRSLSISYSSLRDEYFVYQAECAYKSPANTCPRLGWWISSDLKLVETVVFPDINLLEVEENLSCFSCGCGCYTNEEIIVSDGSIYAHIWGFPIPMKRRGLYKLTKNKAGKHSWNQIIAGRLEAPIKFAPSGCRVVYFKTSLIGDNLEIVDIC